MISRLGLRICEVFRRTAPDPFVLAVLLTLLTAALAMLLRETGRKLSDDKIVAAGERVEQAIIATTPKMKTQSAGKMGFSNTEVGDLVCKALG